MTTTYSLNVASGTPSAIDLANTGATGVIPMPGGLGPFKIPLELLGDGRVAETYLLDLKGSGHDNAATQVQALVQMLRLAKLNTDRHWQDEQVYLKVSTSGESNFRYARVFTAVELEFPDLFDVLFQTNHLVEGFKMTIVREAAWRSAVPGVKGTAWVLDPSDGPAAPSRVAVANFRDDVDITHAWQDDGGVFTDLSTSTGLFPAVPAQNDRCIFLSTDKAMTHIVLPKLSIAGIFTTSTLKLQYYKSATMTDLVLGTDYTVYPGPTLEDALAQTAEDIVISVKVPDDAITTTINSQTGYVIQIIETNASPSYGAIPTTSASKQEYIQRTPHVAVRSENLVGDVSPLVMLRVIPPAGGDENEGFANTSRILIGAKSHGLSKFVAHLNAGGDDNPADWTTTVGTDGTFTAMPKAPGGKYLDCDFSGSSAMASRVQWEGNEIYDSWKGEYRVFVRCEQSGGNAGDCEVKLRAYLGDTELYSPKLDLPVDGVALQGVDEGPELVDLGLLTIGNADYNDDLAELDLIFQVHAYRSTGSSTLKIYDLILLPVDEGGGCGVDDPVNDLDYGGSALRGMTTLDIDAGVIKWRAQRYIENASGDPVPVDEWVLMNRPVPFENLATDTRLYFVMAHYPTTWNVAPLIAEFGMTVQVEVYGHTRYAVLRGGA